MSGPADHNAPTPIPKAIGSLAKRQSDVTRQGTQKLKFVPTLPARRKKDADVKTEPTSQPLPAEADRSKGKGRSRGTDARGRGTGGVSHMPTEMTASGPFAMGPAMAGTASKRVAPRNNMPRTTPQAPQLSTSTVPGAVHSARKAGDNEVSGRGTPSDVEVYSDLDDGVEVIDMDNVRELDWVAPESLVRETRLAGKRRRKGGDKSDAKVSSLKGQSEAPDYSTHALDLSEDEAEEDFENLIDDFLFQPDSNEDPMSGQERLYIFQFPDPFPTFLPPSTALGEAMGTDVAGGERQSSEGTNTKRVSFVTETADDIPIEEQKDQNAPEVKVDGVIGQLELYQSGAVKMRLGNDILYDVTSGIPPSFLQHAVHLDMQNQRLCVLGKISRNFVASPDVDALLAAMDEADRASVGKSPGEGTVVADTA